jgi:hypothetical protein
VVALVGSSSCPQPSANVQAGTQLSYQRDLNDDRSEGVSPLWQQLRQRSAHLLLEALGLLLAPIGIFLGLRVRPMTEPGTIDPYFYTAYLQNGPELIARFGTKVTYFWARVGFILPARLSWWLFGSVPGFFAFRYVLALVAVVPAYLLFRRLGGLVYAWIAVAVLLTSPVILTAWATDYPDSSADSYLVAGIACLAIPLVSARPRLGWIAAAGVLFVLAFASQPVTALSVAAAGIAYLVAFGRIRSRRLVVEAGVMAASAVAAAATLAVASAVWLGAANYLSPTLAALRLVHQADKIAIFHSTTWKWMLYDGYLLVPPALCIAWLVLVAMARRDPSRTVCDPQRKILAERIELFLVLTVALAFTVHALGQFAGGSWTMELYLYTSPLFASSGLLLAATPARARALVGGLAVAAVILVPALIRPARPQLQFELPVSALLLGFLALFAVVAARLSRIPAGAVAAVGVVVGLTYLITTLSPIDKPLFQGQAAYLTPDYGTTLFGDGQRPLDEYTVATQLMTIVPPARERPGRLMLWWGPRPTEAVNRAAAQYLWLLDSLPMTLPVLDDSGAASLRANRCRWLVLLSDTGDEFPPAVNALASRGLQPVVRRDRTFAAGTVTLHVLVVELTSS